ncbi:hypothetical protein DFH08DRAFT_1011194 [Mycena albidolilacea]|uniref:Uncharacterized protein n=1 Tax=Mycena albidolilacea TaxID=1033008 RepID=A0AAD6ZW59_9AGAR|nr:hypothetical protein DFH08DRAFT_1011194 [Mycena albidolilacea]
MDGVQRERVRQESRAWAAGSEPVCGGEQARERRETSARAAEIKGSGQRARAWSRDRARERRETSAQAERMDGDHRARMVQGAHGAGIEGLGGAGGGEQRARMGAGIERGSGGQRANHRARNGAGIERTGSGSVPGGVECRGRKGEVKGGAHAGEQTSAEVMRGRLEAGRYWARPLIAALRFDATSSGPKEACGSRYTIRRRGSYSGQLRGP